MSDDLGPDPLAPWVRELAAWHNERHHTDGVQCRGSIALIDEAARLRGVAQVKLGKAISLEKEVETRPAQMEAMRPMMEAERELWKAMGLPEMREGHGTVQLEIQLGVRGRSASGGDVITFDAHGVHNTHIDGLAHIGADATWHGPIPVFNSETDEDTMVNWAQHGIATRGVALDIAAARGVQWIEAGEPPTTAELDKALEATGVDLQPGDALIMYQGRDHYEAAGNIYPSGASKGPRPGLGEEAAKWIASKEPGLVLWDFHDARMNPTKGLEVHSLIWAIGLCLIDNCLLGPAVRAMKAGGTSAGLLVAAPPAIHRSTGTLINPLVLY
jgi:hypothetical protein